jgi:hypothetical protein
MFGASRPSGGDAAAIPSGWWLLLAALLAVHVLMRRYRPLGHVERVPAWTFAAAYGAAVALVLPWVVTRYVPFIYFQF